MKEKTNFTNEFNAIYDNMVKNKIPTKETSKLFSDLFRSHGYNVLGLTHTGTEIHFGNHIIGFMCYNERYAMRVDFLTGICRGSNNSEINAIWPAVKESLRIFDGTPLECDSNYSNILFSISDEAGPDLLPARFDTDIRRQLGLPTKEDVNYRRLFDSEYVTAVLSDGIKKVHIRSNQTAQKATRMMNMLVNLPPWDCERMLRLIMESIEFINDKKATKSPYSSMPDIDSISYKAAMEMLLFAKHELGDIYNASIRDSIVSVWEDVKKAYSIHDNGNATSVKAAEMMLRLSKIDIMDTEQTISYLSEASEFIRSASPADYKGIESLCADINSLVYHDIVRLLKKEKEILTSLLPTENEGAVLDNIVFIVDGNENSKLIRKMLS